MITILLMIDVVLAALCIYMVVDIKLKNKQIKESNKALHFIELKESMRRIGEDNKILNDIGKRRRKTTKP